jgi:hypothetical protein
MRSGGTSTLEGIEITAILDLGRNLPILDSSLRHLSEVLPRLTEARLTEVLPRLVEVLPRRVEVVLEVLPWRRIRHCHRCRPVILRERTHRRLHRSCCAWGERILSRECILSEVSRVPLIQRLVRVRNALPVE